jgi:hypothetical protein
MIDTPQKIIRYNNSLATSYYHLRRLGRKRKENIYICKKKRSDQDGELSYLKSAINL